MQYARYRLLHPTSPETGFPLCVSNGRNFDLATLVDNEQHGVREASHTRAFLCGQFTHIADDIFGRSRHALKRSTRCAEVAVLAYTRPARMKRSAQYIGSRRIW